MKRRDKRLLSLRECERIYRLRNGTAGDAFRRGLLPGRKTPKATWVSAKRAEELWGIT